MAEEKKVINETATESSEATRDTSMNIGALLKQSKEVAPEENKEVSPLEQMKHAKENGQTGLVVDNNELKEESKGPTKMSKTLDEADEHVETYMDDLDRQIEVAKKLKAKKPTTAPQMAALMDEVEAIADGKKKVEDSELVELVTDEDKKKKEVSENPDEESSDEINEEEEEKEEEISEEKKMIVQVMIDKTGLGGDYNFTEEEAEKLRVATEIRLKEIEEIDIPATKIKAASKPFIESIKEYQMASSMIPVTFPASRFKAQMTGLSYGEIGDIILNSENVTFDQVQKRLSIIYNKMINPSIKIDSFEDFLRKFAYTDIDVAIYGLIVATFPEVDDIPMKCNKASCNADFTHNFSPRSLIRWDKMDEKFMNELKNIIDNPDDGEELAKSSPTQNWKRIQLPYSKFVVDIGIASSYDYLYEIVDNTVGDKFTEEHPDDVNGILQLNTLLLGLIRRVLVPDEDGNYVAYENFEDKIHALYYIKSDEIGIISAILNKYMVSYTPVFALTNVVCPKCGMVTKSVPVDLNTMVFQRYQRQMSSELNIENVSVL